MEKKMSEKLLEVQMMLEDCFEQKTSLNWLRMNILITQINEVRQELR